MTQQEYKSPQVIFIEAPKVITAKIVRQRSFRVGLPVQLSWKAKLVVASCLIAGVLILWSATHLRILLPELAAVSILTAIGLLGVHRVIRKEAQARTRGVGIVYLVVCGLGFVLVSLPAVQRGFARVHLVNAIRAEGKSVVISGDEQSRGLGWIQVRKGVFIPRLLVDFFGGPAMISSIEMIELPQDLLTPRMVRALHEPSAKYATGVKLEESLSKRPPDAASFQLLLATTNIYEIDATWFDAASFRMLAASQQKPQYIDFDGRFSDEAMECLRSLSANRPYYLGLSNFKTEDFMKLNALVNQPGPLQFHIHGIRLDNCTLTAESAKVIAQTNFAVSFDRTTRVDIITAAENGVRLNYFRWNGTLSKQEATSLAKNPYIAQIFGTIEPEEGAIEALSNSQSLWSFQVTKTPITDSDIEFLLKMPALYDFHMENCEASFESIQKLASKPGLKTIMITNGPLSPAELGALRRATSLGNAELYQSNFVPRKSEP